MNKTLLTHELEKLSDKIFDNQEDFVAAMFPHLEDFPELLDVHFNPYSCRVSIVLNCGQHVVDSTPIEFVYSWLEGRYGAD
jgi:hypothetical protein